MTWTTSKTFVAGDVLTAAELNTYLRDNTTQLYNDLTTATANIANTMMLIGSDLNERTTTNSGAYADLSTITPSPSATPATSELLVVVPYRKTSGAAAFASLLIKVTTSGGAVNVITASPVTDSVNLAGSGLLVARIPPRYTNYVNSAYWEAGFLGSTATAYSGSGSLQRQTGTLTSVIVQGNVSSSSITLGIQGVKLYALP